MKSEFKNFNRMVTHLLNVPHSEIKAKLDEEKTAKAKKRKTKKSSASREASDRV